MTTFIDWINIAQDHIGVEVPHVVGAYLTQTNKNSLHEWTIGKFEQHCGSYDTSVMLRSFGTRVEVRGNVGRLNRPDNIFNHDFDATIARTTALLDDHGLPHFAAGEWRTLPDMSSRFYTGATVSLLHVTRNYATGSAKNAIEFLNYLATQSLANVKRSRAGSSTIRWGNKGGRKFVKAYLKAPEMKAHISKKEWTPEHDRLYEYCNDVGLVRLELEAGRKLLDDNGLRGLGDINMGKLIKLFDDAVEGPLLHPQSVQDGYPLDQLSRKARLAFVAWERGADLLAEDFCSKATLYRYASEIREKLGVSILEKRDFETLPVRYKVIQPQAIVKPDWYQMAA